MNVTYLKSLTDHYLNALPAGTRAADRPVGFAISVRSEADRSTLFAQCTAKGIRDLRSIEERKLFRKQWLVAGIAPAMRMRPSDIHEWLDGMDGLARTYNGTLETWWPVALPDEKL